MGKIGFKSYDEEPQKKDSKKEEKEPKNVVMSVINGNRKVFTDLLLQKYATEGTFERAEFVTSSQLLYEFREMCTLSLPDVAAVMNELKFRTACIGNEFAWVLYLKVQDWKG